MRRLLLCAAALLSGTAFADTIAITGGTVAIGDGSQPIPNGVVVIRDGRVVAAGANVAVPAGARVISASLLSPPRDFAAASASCSMT